VKPFVWESLILAGGGRVGLAVRSGRIIPLDMVQVSDKYDSVCHMLAFGR
jgi:hypothetical protein